MPLVDCSSCGKQISDDAPACPHCGQPARGTGRRRGMPTWAKILLFLVPGAVLVGLIVANKPSDAELRQAIRDKGKELQARGALGPPVLIDDPQHAERFTYHDHFISSEIKYTRDDGKVITVAVGLLGDITVSEKWEGGR